MVSLNYRKNVVANILKEDFDPEEFINQYKQLSLTLNKIGSNKFYLAKEQNEFITIYYPASKQVTKPFYDSYQLEDKLDSISDLISSDTLKLNQPNDNKGYITYITLNKLKVFVKDTIDALSNEKIVAIYFSKTKPDNFDGILTNYFQKTYTLDEVKKLLTDRISPIFDKQNKNLKKYSKNFIRDLTNASLDIISKELEVIENITTDNKPNLPSGDDSVFYAKSKKQDENAKPKKGRLMLDPQHLIRTEKYMNVNTIKLTVQNSLQRIKKLESKHPLNYMAAEVVDDTIENTAEGNASKKVDIINAETNKKFPALSQKDRTRKFINSIQTLDGLKNDTVGYSLVLKISTQPVEILSPIVLANMDSSIKWGHDGDMTSNQIIEKLFGRENMKKALISYPEAGEQFFDSYMAIPCENGHKIMKVSTKGGVNGKGAAASMNSLYNMLVDHSGKQYDNSEKIVKSVKASKINVGNYKEFLKSLGYDLTPYAIELLKKYPAEVTFIIIFGGTKKADHKTIFEYLKRNDFFGIDYSHCNDLSQYIKASTLALNITDCVIELLNFQKYDISQINCVPRIEGDKFWYDYEIQYPAHFSGSVQLEKVGNRVSFHMVGGLR